MVSLDSGKSINGGKSQSGYVLTFDASGQSITSALLQPEQGGLQMGGGDGVLPAGELGLQTVQPIDQHRDDLLIRRAVVDSGERSRCLGVIWGLLNKLQDLSRCSLVLEVRQFVFVSLCYDSHFVFWLMEVSPWV